MMLFCATFRKESVSVLRFPFLCHVQIIIIYSFRVLLDFSLEFEWQHPHVSRILLSILAAFNNAVVWMVSTRPTTFKSSRPFNNYSVTVPKAPITIGTIDTFMFHSVFNSLARSRYLSFFSHSFSLILWSAGIIIIIIITIIIIIIIITANINNNINDNNAITICEFFTSDLPSDFHWSLNDSKFS